MSRARTRSLLLRLSALGLLSALGAVGCGSRATARPDGNVAPAFGRDSGSVVSTQPSSAEAATTQMLTAELSASAGMTADDFATRYAVPLTTGIAYDPMAAQGLELIQASPLGLNPTEQSMLAQRGFVISARQPASFIDQYLALFAADLPVYISADSILYAVHKSYDAMLAALEEASLSDDLGALLAGMHAALPSSGALTGDGPGDADLFLAVSRSLLAGRPIAPVLGANPDVDRLVAQAQAAQGTSDVQLFGATRTIDFSQFKPRGHYTRSDALKQYFRAMMWLGRSADLRIIDTQSDGTQLFRRRQLELALGLRSLMGQTGLASWNRINSVIEGFVGTPDSMTPPQVDALMSDLGLSDPAGLAALDDQSITQAIRNGGYGAQLIPSQMLVNGTDHPLPPSAVFLLFGQRYVIDSHVFSNLVYDRVGHGQIKRMMPNPLDVAFAALANDQAGALLAPEIQQFGYQADLHAMRLLVDAHGDDYFETNLYNLWLGALRTLSPERAFASPDAVGLPSLARTEAWGRRILSTQLASWAELRHDTILYAKQSETGGIACEYPDGYVDPYPELFGKLKRFADRGQEIVGGLNFSSTSTLKQDLSTYFQTLSSTSAKLEELAQYQRTGLPFTADQMAFVNQTIIDMRVCGGPPDGWYTHLFFQRFEINPRPTIADVHTQPTDEAGNTVGKVLHVGTGSARLMVVTVDTCSAPRAYIGPVSSYYETITSDFQRLDDDTWESMLTATPPADVPWMSDLVAR